MEKLVTIVTVKIMDIQSLIVGIIILAACIYVGRIIYRKLKSTVSKNSCGSNCGCDTTGSVKKKSFAQINKI